MADKRVRVKNPKDTTANWNKANPILLDGEIGIEIKPDHTIAIKIGDGKTAWKLLKYATKTIAELNAEKESLQEQLDNIVIAASESGDVTAEVSQARVNAAGTNYSTLKSRLDASDTAHTADVIKIDERLSHIRSNLNFDDVEFIGTGMIRSDDGKVKKDGITSFKYTDYIDISKRSGGTITFTLPVYTSASGDAPLNGLAFYDSDKVFISSIQTLKGDKGASIVSKPIPDNAAYVRTTWFVETDISFNLSVEQVFEENNDLTNGYIVTGDTEIVTGIWVRGQIYNATGEVNAVDSKLNRITSDRFFSDTIVSTGSDYEMLIYAYKKSNNEYLGRLTSDGTFLPTDGVASWGEKFNLTSYPDYKFRFIFRKKDSSNFTDEELSSFSINSIPAVAIKSLSKGSESGDDSSEYIYPILGSPEIYVPSVEEKTLIDDLTSEDIFEIYDSLCSTYPNWIKQEDSIGLDSDNNEIRSYTIRMNNPVFSSNAASPVTNNNWNDSYDNKHVLVVAGQHGDEKSSVLGVAEFCQELLQSNEKWSRFIKSNFVIHVLPLVNVWGFNNFTRNNKNDLNINRDYTDFQTSEAKAIADFIDSLGDKLKVCLDSHNTTSKYGYLVTNTKFKNNIFYTRASTTIAAALQDFLATAYNNESLYPYIVTWNSNSGDDTLGSYTQRLGILGHSIETPRNFSSSNGTNYKNTCAMVKGFMANLIQMYGSI